MIKTHFVFAVSFVALMAVNSAWANAPTSGQSVGTAHTVYTDQTPTSGAGIAGVSYVNKAVNKAGASAQAAEAHAAAAGASALSAADSAAAAAASAKTANDALATKADKSELSNYVTSAEFGAVSGAQSELIGTVADLTTQVADLETDKQNKLTAGTNITISGNTISAKDTTYSTGNATTSGLTKLYTGTGSNTDGTMTQKAINEALAGKLSTSGTAAKATADASGNTITSTYATKSELTSGLSGKQGTLKAGANITIASDGTISATDTNTHVTVDSSLSSTSTNPVQNKVINAALSDKLDKTAKAASATTADSATKATQDASGNVITSTYATKSELTSGLSGKQGTLKAGANITIASDGTISATDTNTHVTVDSSLSSTSTNPVQNKAVKAALDGKQATLTTSNIKGSGSVSVAVADGVITVSGTDNNTTYSTGNATTSGLTKLYTGTGSNTDGTMTQKALTDALAGKQGTLTAGSNITISNGTISAKDTVYTLPTATADTLGGVKVDTALSSTSTNPVQNKAVKAALDGKQATISDLSTIRSGAAAGATAVQDLEDLGITATATELNYVDGVTSNIQTQLNAKQASLGYTAENAANKVTSVSSTSTDTQYPSAKAMYTALSGKLSTTGNAASATKATQDGNGKVIADTYATKAELNALSGTAGTLSTDVATLQTQVSGLEVDKQNKLTATGSANRPVYATAGGVAAVTGISIPVGSATATSSTTWASIWVE